MTEVRSLNKLKPSNPLVTPLLTDMYQISMAYGYWKGGKADDNSVFDLFFRKSPFRGQFCLFAGLDEVLKLLDSFRFTQSDVDYLKTIMTTCDTAFFDWLLTLDCSRTRVYAMREGSLVFPGEPLLRVEGPLVIGQLLETTLLNLINFPSLICTNAARMKIAAGEGKVLLEFGLRRAQGPDGALSASKYSYIGGFTGTSNVLAGKMFGMGAKGTMAHAYIMCHTSMDDLRSSTITNSAGKTVEFLSIVLEKRRALGYASTNNGELASFVSYAQAFPRNFLALVDTYDTLASGVPNFLIVGHALFEVGYQPVGIRLDSGNLSTLSKDTRKLFNHTDIVIGKVIFSNCAIVASNDINEESLLALAAEGHEVNTFGIGTNLVTCQKQPALGCVYKLVELNQTARIKLSEDVEKIIIPGRKNVYRLYGRDDKPLLDIMQNTTEPAPVAGTRILCRHPFHETDRAYVTPFKVVEILELVFDNGRVVIDLPTPESSRNLCLAEMAEIRPEHVRPVNPVPYRVSLSDSLYETMHKLLKDETPIKELA